MTVSEKEESVPPIASVKVSVKRHAAILQDMAEDDPFTVFLCGPTLEPLSSSTESRIPGWVKKLIKFQDSKSAVFAPAAMVRKQLIEVLEKNSFEVVLGEDAGLEDQRLKVGMNAQDNELQFLRNCCNAVVIVASSVGSFCELGLFSWHYVHRDGYLNNRDYQPAFIVLVDKKFESHKSYLNEGPVRSILAFGHAMFVNYESFDPDQIIKILKERRSVYTQDRRGRPRGGAK